MPLLRRLWPAKIAAKIVLARLPIPYGIWHQLGAFRHGRMNEMSYARRVFDGHCTTPLAGHLSGTSLLELGPGDSLLSAVYARWGGASRITLVDVARFASSDVGMYREAAASLRYASDGPAPQPSEWKSLDHMLEDCRATYLTDGLRSLQLVASNSINHSWSNAVLEHVRRSELKPLLGELARATVEGGTTSHQVDFRDHLGGGRAHLRVGSDLWERDWFALKSGFYTNRYQFSSVKGLIEAAGFEIQSVSDIVQFDENLDRSGLAAEFRDLDEASLMIAGALLKGVKGSI